MFSIPSTCFSLIDYVIENFPNWNNLDSINIYSSAYDKMKDSPYLQQSNNVWTREVSLTEDNGKYLLPLSYELKQIKFDLWQVLWIEYDGTRKYFATNPIGKSICICNN